MTVRNYKEWNTSASAITQFTQMKPAQIDAIIWESIIKINDVVNESIANTNYILKFYDRRILCLTIYLTKSLWQCIESDTRIMIKDNPVFMI